MLERGMWDYLGKFFLEAVRAAGTLAAVYWGAKLAIVKFHTEKRWEKREAAYTELFKALQGMADEMSALAIEPKGGVLSEHMKEMERAGELGRLHLEAMIRLGAWHLSEETIKILIDMRSKVFEERRRRVQMSRLSDRIPSYKAEQKLYLEAMVTAKSHARWELEP